MAPSSDEIPISDTLAAYTRDATTLAERYAAVDRDPFFAWHDELMPPPPGPVLDIGAGSGVLADAFAKRGYETVATEPSAGMAKESLRLFPNNGVLFFEEALPDLPLLRATTGPYTMVVVDAVWMHIPPSQQDEAWASLEELVAAGGLLSMLIRFGPAPAERPMHVVDMDVLIVQAADHGFSVAKLSDHRPNQTGPDDGSTFRRICFRKGGD